MCHKMWGGWGYMAALRDLFEVDCLTHPLGGQLAKIGFNRLLDTGAHFSAGAGHTKHQGMQIEPVLRICF